MDCTNYSSKSLALSASHLLEQVVTPCRAARIQCDLTLCFCKPNGEIVLNSVLICISLITDTIVFRVNESSEWFSVKDNFFTLEGQFGTLSRHLGCHMVLVG